MNVKLPRYPKYKDSGVEWLGKVPEHWDLKPLFTVAKERNESNRAMRENNLLSLSYGRIVQKDIDSNDGLLPESFETYQIVYPGDIVFRLTDLQNDKRSLRTALVEERGIITSAYLALAPKKVRPHFINYLLRGYDEIKVFYSMGGGLRQSLKFSDVKRLPVLVPPREEQTRITTFLEREIGKIDALVGEQLGLIEFLKEKRKAIISYAVTKGLNPNVRMKDSAIKGMDAVPEHWDITVIKRFSTLQRGHDLTDADRTEGPYPVVTSGGISGTHGAFKARGPGVVTGRYGSTGKLFFIEENFWPHNTSLYVSDFHGNYARFVWYALQTVDFAAHSAKSAVPGIDRNDIHVLPVVVPPHEEQLAISHFLDSETARVELLIAEATHAIGLLQERRTALISAAITGQIDTSTYRSEACNVVALQTRKASPGFVRTVLAAEIVHQLHLEPTFGHVKFQKIFHLAQYYAEIEDFDSNYTRQAAGPFDHGLVKSVEKQMRNAKWYDCQRDEGRYYFSPMEKAGGHGGYFTSYYGAKRDKIQHIIDLCRKMTTEQCEIVSTLYGAWNDLLLAGSAFTDEVIVQEVLTHWHSAKERIDESRWKRALGWMRDHDLTPKGKGKPIKTRVAEGRA